MTRTTWNKVQRSQASSTPFVVLELEPLSLHLPAPKIFPVKSLLRKGKLPLTKHHPSNPKRRAFSTSDEVEATCLVLKGLFPWQQESQGSRTVLPAVHTEPSYPCPKVWVQIHLLCHLGIGNGGQADYIQPQLENTIFPWAPLVWPQIKQWWESLSCGWRSIRPSWNLLTEFFFPS